MEEQQNQAVVLQQPKDSMLVVKVEQDTDLVAIGALVVSVLAFLVTIHIVRQSTKSQIESNKLLIEKQNELKLAELRIINRKAEVDKLRDSIYEYISVIQNFKYYYIQVFYFKEDGSFFHKEFKKFKKLFLENKEKIGEVTYKVFLNFNPIDSNQYELQQEMMELLILSNKMLSDERDENIIRLKNDEFIKKFETILFKLRLMIQL
ncbi:hypothetical protein [Acinetobacter pecorum]|uniref:Transmembrane protein n=1 Tax=Acinetobacter pecorum TaxID=2762215 RepID=A0ABR8VWH7_9GAMM|nr:hypothetical protein [Acinetobacter pecorum]MBD8009110.1 hypothetical protein [Acinetobacter pecorum]